MLLQASPDSTPFSMTVSRITAAQQRRPHACRPTWSWSATCAAFHSQYQGGQPEASRINGSTRAWCEVARDQRILASHRFNVSQAANDTSVPAVVSAFGQAGDQLAREVLEWTLSQGKAARQP